MKAITQTFLLLAICTTTTASSDPSDYIKTNPRWGRNSDSKQKGSSDRKRNHHHEVSDSRSGSKKRNPHDNKRSYHHEVTDGKTGSKERRQKGWGESERRDSTRYREVVDTQPDAQHPENAIGGAPAVGNATIVNVEHFDNALKSVDIDTYERGSDYAAAFEKLRRSSPSSNIFAVVKGRSFDRICDMETMPNASLIMIRYGGACMQTEVVPVEDIEELGIRGYSGSPVHVYFPQSTDHRPHDHHHVHDVEDIPSHHNHPHVHINASPFGHDLTDPTDYSIRNVYEQINTHEGEDENEEYNQH
jgi:hypothetical protein